MHRSRLSTLLIDTPPQHAAAGAAFWSRALGVRARPAAGEPQFTDLPGAAPHLVVAVQALQDTDENSARYHVDVETDDLDAETGRLLALGAVEVGRWLDCRTLRAPGGHLLCVIPVHSDPEEFRRHARTWP
ncbi:VOC family protein [Kineococcus indalonis]|uniref:VOC family protein n=1 Tax=Kineococcus indalonis TaxID=2696566 RepID=UPI001412D6F2|nr:VOC family protein [Kineococcus indalonis]NAZ86977.1 glyoxalase/bleomycin resistance/dioxygenase family protein [Kineococcus indalonis]